MTIDWQLTGKEIEAESFRRIDEMADSSGFGEREWHVVRRLIHTTGNFSIAQLVGFRHDPITAGLHALEGRAQLFCDSNMMAAGISTSRLQQMNAGYTREDIHCFVGDSDIGQAAAQRGITRSLAAVEKAEPILNGGIALIGNAPMALAGLVQMIQEERVTPRLVISMPVGFVHVLEAKEMLAQTDVPHIEVSGYRGGTTLAVAALHGIIENAAAGDRPGAQ